MPTERESTPPPPGDSTAPAAYPASVDALIAEFARLPGIGRRSAERMAHHVLKSTAEDAMRLADAIAQVKRSVRHCPVCVNFADADLCRICADPRRDRSLVLVVEQPRDLIALEATAMYRGLYHVLLGRMNPLEGIGARDITLARLLQRLDHPENNPGAEPVREVILGLNPTLEGDGTALFIAQELKARKVKVSRLARGLPSGGQIELANRGVLGDAIEGRRGL